MERQELLGRAAFERRVRALEALGHRGSATENEDKAADDLVAELGELGLEAVKEPFEGSDSLGARVLVHVVVAAVGLLSIWVSPWVTIGLGALVLFSFVGEMNTHFRLLSKVHRSQASRNVVGRISPTGVSEARHRIILMAHYDSQRTGKMWRGTLVKRLSRLYQRVPGPMKSPTFPVMAAFVVQPFAGIAALVVPDSLLLLVTLYSMGLVYAVAAYLLYDWSRGPFVPGAADNASGVAAALELTGRWLQAEHEEAELVVLLTGCEESGCLGAAAWADAHKEEIGAIPTLFLNLDTFGYGAPRFIDRELSLAGTTFETSADLVSLCERAAESLGLEGAGPHTLPTFTDGIALMARGVQGVSLLSFEDGVHLPNYHQLSDTADNMDFDVGWSAVGLAWEVLSLLAHEDLSARR